MLIIGKNFANMLTNIIHCHQLESMDYRPLKAASSYVYSFWHDTGVWRTERQADRRTDRNAIAMRRSEFSSTCCRNQFVTVWAKSTVKTDALKRDFFGENNDKCYLTCRLLEYLWFRFVGMTSQKN